MNLLNLFQTEPITPNEKIILFYIYSRKEHFNIIRHSVPEIGRLLGISYNNVINNLKSLNSKNYLEMVKFNSAYEVLTIPEYFLNLK